MIKTIDLQRQDLLTLQRILQTHLPPSVHRAVFGSRVTGSARRYSDLDLALEDDKPLDPALLRRLAEALSESDMTIKVDVIDLQTVDPTFRREIEAGMIALPSDETST